LTRLKNNELSASWDTAAIDSESLSQYPAVSNRSCTTLSSVNLRPLTKLEGGLQSLHNAGNDAVNWLEKVAT